MLKSKHNMKAELRKTIRERKRQFTSQALGELSLAVISQLERHPRFVQAHTLMLYYSLPDEVSTHRLIDRLEGKTILLPRVTGEGTMELRRYTGPADLAVGAYGIMEPTGQVFTDYERIDLAVVPGMAFDPAGHRLGRGKGYYDRFLARVPHLYKIGICFGFQLFDHIPVEETDITMDCVLSSR